MPFDELHDLATNVVRLALKNETDKKEYVMNNFIALYIPSILPNDGLYLISRNKYGFRAGIQHGIKHGFLNQKVLSVSFHRGDVTVTQRGANDSKN